MAGLFLQGSQPTVAKLSAADFLRTQAQGPYTSLIVRNNKEVLYWRKHLFRLATSLVALGWTDLQLDSQSQTRFWEQHCFELETTLLPQLGAALRVHRSDGTSGTDASVVILLGSNRGKRTASLHVSACAWPTASLLQPCSGTLFFCGPRAQPAVKHSSWATVREPLERHLPHGSEGILCEPDGRLLEGFVTNLFIVRDDGAVQTADPARHNILEGVVRDHVLELLRSWGCRVSEEPPCIDDSHCWTEAFVTNCRRLIQPVNFMSASAGASEEHRDWKVELKAPGPLTAELQRALLASQSERSLLL